MFKRLWHWIWDLDMETWSQFYDRQDRLDAEDEKFAKEMWAIMPKFKVKE